MTVDLECLVSECLYEPFCHFKRSWSPKEEKTENSLGLKKKKKKIFGDCKLNALMLWK